MTSDETIKDFLDKLASGEPTPGGGGAAALCGAMGAALCSMVCNLTIGKKKYQEVNEEMKAVLEKSEYLRQRFRELVEEDVVAFNGVMQAFSLPKETEAEKEIRRKAIEEATKKAALVPLEMMHFACELLPLALSTAIKGNEHALSDAGVSALFAGATAQSAALNVHINLLGLQDRQWATEKFAEMNRMLQEVRGGTEEVLKIVAKKFQGEG